MNSAYDLDPLVGSTAMSGFSQWAAIYYYYRVLRFGYRWEVCNNESIPLIASCAPTKNDVGANYSSCQEFGEFPYGQSKLLPASGGQNRHVFTGVIDLAKYLGHTGYLYDDTSSAAVTANPLHEAYMNFAINNSSSGVNQIGFRLTIWQDVQFYGLQTPAA